MVRLGIGSLGGVLLVALLAACGADSGGSDFTPGGSGTGATPGGAGGTLGDGDGAGGVPGDGDGDGGGGAAAIFMPGTDPARNQVQAGQMCRRLAEIQCAGEAYCCDSPGRSMADCVTVMEQGCNQDLYLDEIAAEPAAAFDAARAASAFQAFEDLAGQCDPTIAKWASEDSGLRGIMRGTKDGLCTPLTISGSAQAQRAGAAAALASCTLASDLACLPDQTGVWQCQQRGGAGSPCFSDFNCSPTAYCDNPSGLIEGSSCKARKAVGQGCAYFFECTSLLCAGGSCVDGDVQAAYCLDR